MFENLGDPSTWGDDTLRIVMTLGCLTGLGASYLIAVAGDLIRGRSAAYWTAQRVYRWGKRRHLWR